MRNNLFKLAKYLYYLSLVALLILYLFPGSLLGLFLYGNSGQQPNIIKNPIGTSVNHLFFFIYLSVLGFFTRLKKKEIINSFEFLFCISILLEFTHWLIPKRAFEYYDLFGNVMGVIIAYLLINFFLKMRIK